MPVCLFLDEAANIGKISDLETEIAVLRGRDISVVLGLQSYSQLEAIYGREKSQVILDNCTTKIILSGTDAETAERISKMLGERTLVEERTSYSQSDNGSSTNTSTAKSARRLMFANEVREIDRNEQLIISGNRKPIYHARFHYQGEPNTAQAPELGEAITADFTHLALPAPEPKKKKSPPPMPEFLHKKVDAPSQRFDPDESNNDEPYEPPRYTTQPLEQPTELLKIRGKKLLDEEESTFRRVEPFSDN